MEFPFENSTSRSLLVEKPSFCFTAIHSLDLETAAPGPKISSQL